MRARALILAGAGCLGLAGCNAFAEPPHPGSVVILGAEASRADGGVVHLDVLLQNSGGDDGNDSYDAAFCVHATWLAGGTVTTKSWFEDVDGGTQVTEAVTCDVELGPGADSPVQLVSPLPITEKGLFVRVTVDAPSSFQARVVSSPDPA